MEKITRAAPRRMGSRLKALATDVKEAPEAEVRRDIRPELREDDPRARAAKRAAEIKGHMGGNMDEGTDEFYIPEGYVPEGWTYEWKRKLLIGQEDPAYQVALARMGWEPVPASRHRNMMPEGHYNTIERKGMVLMERPAIITAEAKLIEKNKARNQIRQKEAQLSASDTGQFERAGVKLSKSYEPIPFADE